MGLNDYLGCKYLKIIFTDIKIKSGDLKCIYQMVVFMKYRILTLLPSHVPTYGIGHAALSIAEGMKYKALDSMLLAHSIDKSIKTSVVTTIVPSFFSKIFYKFFYKILPKKTISKATDFLFLMKIKPNDIVYFWPGSSLFFLKKVKEKGNIIIMENINCHQKISRDILDKESVRLNLKNTHSITQQSIDDESEKLGYCDFVFSPSPGVTRSLLAENVSIDKILQTSYGLCSHQQVDISLIESKRNKPLEVIFVGRVGMRKGIHLLLQYWVDAQIEGILKVVGNVEEPIQAIIEPYRQIKNIQFIDFVSDIEEVYKTADIFVLPSLEEGSPLVTYLALGAGLPCIVSPMGGEGVVTHNHDGFIIDAHDQEGWVNALQSLANSMALRQKQSLAARESSNKFLWQKVGQQRAELLINKLKKV